MKSQLYLVGMGLRSCNFLPIAMFLQGSELLEIVNNGIWFGKFDFNYVYSWTWDRNFPTGWFEACFRPKSWAFTARLIIIIAYTVFSVRWNTLKGPFSYWLRSRCAKFHVVFSQLTDVPAHNVPHKEEWMIFFLNGGCDSVFYFGTPSHMYASKKIHVQNGASVQKLTYLNRFYQTFPKK